MKILALSDVHGDRTFIKQMAEKGAKEKVDLVILAGDLADHAGNVHGLIGPFKEKGLEVAIIPGNHEGMAEIGFLTEKYGIKNLHGYAVKRGDVGIFGCGYADVGVHQLEDEDFFKTLKKAHDSLTGVRKKLMVTHVQPNDSIIGLKMPGWGSSGVRRAIEELKPNVHICGHIHETHGIEEVIGSTRVINVGKTGRIIEL
ncbi:metallophosphoesterase family protein [Candidatus Woesearchaeota archaeon]|nr:metallophosphoesterase family protein [Candidatus Woesearchaeota archaeon]